MSYKASVYNYFGEEIELHVEGYYNPYEAPTYTYPGVTESYEIEEVTVVETGAEVCLLDEDDIECEILDKIHEGQEVDDYI